MVSRTFVVVAILLGAGCSIPMAPHGGSGSEVGKIHDAASTPADAVIVDAGVAAANVAVDAAPCAEVAAIPAATEILTLVPTAFADLPGWADDHLSEAVPSFRKSCVVIDGFADDKAVGFDGFSGHARDWRAACRAAAKVANGDDVAARGFFEHEFAAYSAQGAKGADGKMTAFNVQSIHASKKRHGAFRFPIYRRPPDLVAVNLSAFIADSKGRTIWGRVEHGALTSYLTRAEIRQGALANQGLELLWADDAIDVLYAEIEGSAKATLDDGSVVWLEFDGKNGRGYHGIGKILHDLGALQPGHGTMQEIRAWFVANPSRLNEVIDQNASMVFFKNSVKSGAMGSEGVVLTAGRSAAVDRAFVAHGTPIWVDTKAPNPGAEGSSPWQHLVIAQDTGGGIIGPVRDDLYMGDDAVASELGGRMGAAGRDWLLLPKHLKITSPAK